MNILILLFAAMKDIKQNKFYFCLFYIKQTKQKKSYPTTIPK